MPRYPSDMHIVARSSPPSYYCGIYQGQNSEIKHFNLGSSQQPQNRTLHEYTHEKRQHLQETRSQSTSYRYSNANSASKEAADIAERFIRCRFPHPPTQPNIPEYDKVEKHKDTNDMRIFIWNVLNSSEILTHSTDAVVYAALLLLQRVRECIKSSGAPYPKSERAKKDNYTFRKELFVSALIIAHKYHCDDSWTSEGWSIITNRLFNTPEIIGMQRQISEFLDFTFYHSPVSLADFRTGVKANFSSPLPPLEQIDCDWAENAKSKYFWTPVKQTGLFDVVYSWKPELDPSEQEIFIPTDEDEEECDLADGIQCLKIY